MPSPFLLPPIIERELRVASRHGTTYWSRVGAGAAGSAIFFWVMMAQLAYAPAAQAGQATFRLLAGAAAFNVLTSVLNMAAAAFAREKREDTLGLLFLTPLRPIDLALGKLVSSSLIAFYRFIAIVPLLALPMLVGGVTAGNFLLLVLALANLVFLGATIGLYVSALTWDEKRSATIANVTMLALTVLLPGLLAGLATWLPGRPIMACLTISPAFPVWQATVIGGGLSTALWLSLLLTHVAGWLFFAATCRALPHCWRNRPAAPEPRRQQLRRVREEEMAVHLALVESPRAPRPPAANTAVKIRSSVRRQFDTHHRAHLLDRNPMLWLALRWRVDATASWILGSLGLVGLVVIGVTGQWQALVEPGFVLAVSFFANIGFKSYVAAQASYAFARDRGENTLDLLLATPVSPRQLIEGHVLALREPLRRWIWIALGIEAGWFALALTVHVFGDGHYFWLYLLYAGAILGFLIPDLHALGWVALWQGVISKNARAAESNGYSQVFVLPWLMVTFSAFLPNLINWRPIVAPLWFVMSYILFSALADWWFIRRSRRRLHTDLALWAKRRAAGELEHYDGWRRVGRRLGRWWRVRSRPVTSSRA